jgi:putative transposase
MTPNTYHWKKLNRYNNPYHARELTFSCYKKYPYFSDPIACKIFLDFLDNAGKKYKFELWAYVIMPDHIHLLIYRG